MSNFLPYNQRQRMFDAICPYDLIPTDHPAFIVDKVVNNLDLSNIYKYYNEEGNPAYHPMMMLKVLFYSYFLGIHSCRKIWDSLKYRADFIFLSAKQVPDFRTINEFRKRHADELPGLFSQIVHLCACLGMIDFKELAIDGQKIKANANFRKSKNRYLLAKSHQKIQKKIKMLLAEDPEVADVKNEERLQRLMKQEEDMLELTEMFKTIEEDTLINTTDRDAKVMKHKDGRSLPSYNHQSAVDGKYGVTLAVNTKDSPDSASDLKILLNLSQENTGNIHKNVMADSAFCDFDTLEEASKNTEQNILLKDKLIYSSQRSRYNKENFSLNDNGDLICPAGFEMKKVGVFKHNKRRKIKYEGINCENCQSKDLCTKGKKRTINIDTKDKFKQEMRNKFKQKENKELYYRRGAIVEPSFGNDQHNYKWIQHHLRGAWKASLEFMLVRIGSNLRKIWRYRAMECLELC